MKPIMSDYLPKPRCTTELRKDYEKACKLEGVNLNSNIRDMVVDYTRVVFLKHGVKPKRTTGAGNK